MGHEQLCGSLNALARETWAHIDHGYRLGYGLPDERAFTDHHLIELTRHHPAEVRVAKINQNREAETGADFEWWLGQGERYLPMRVQAKKLDLASSSYAQIAHTSGRDRDSQIDRLIKTSREDGFLPIYCFFNGPLPTREWPRDRCENRELEPDLRGCTVALASDVKTVLAAGRGAASVASISWPWQCLICCPLARGTHVGQRALSVLRQAGSEGTIDIEMIPPPAYLRRLLEADGPPEGEPSDDEPLPGAPTVVAMTSRS